MEQCQIEYQQINRTLSNIKAKASASNAEPTGQDPLYRLQTRLYKVVRKLFRIDFIVKRNGSLLNIWLR